MAKVTVSFTLDSETDTKIVEWLDGFPKRQRSKAIRVALAEYLGETPHAVTLGDIYTGIQALAGDVTALGERGRALTGGVTLGDLHAGILALSRKVESGVVLASNGGGDLPEPEEPEDLAAALDKLADKSREGGQA